MNGLWRTGFVAIFEIKWEKNLDFQEKFVYKFTFNFCCEWSNTEGMHVVVNYLNFLLG